MQQGEGARLSRDVVLGPRVLAAELLLVVLLLLERKGCQGVGLLEEEGRGFCGSSAAYDMLLIIHLNFNKLTPTH